MRFVLLETLHPDAEELLREAGDVVLADAPVGPSPLALIADADAVLTRGRGRVTAELLAAAPRLRTVARCGVGVDNIDVDAASARGIPVLFAPGTATSTLAEHTLGLMLAACRQLPMLDRAVAAGEWSARDHYQGRELAGASLGIVGLGDIGRRVAHLATAFGMRVRYWSPTSRDAAYEYAELDSLCATADVLSLHVALTPQSRGLIDARRLALMGSDAILVNSARGGLVDEQAVADALDAGRLGSYAADVLDREPPAPDARLPGHPRTILTPHTGVLTDRAYRSLCVSTAVNVVRVVRGERPDPGSIANRDRVGPARGW